MAKLETKALSNFLFSDLFSRKYVVQIFTYPESATSFCKTGFY